MVYPGNLPACHYKEDCGDGFTARNTIIAGFGFIGTRLLIGDDEFTWEVVLDEPDDKSLVQGRPGARVPIKLPAKASFEKIIQPQAWRTVANRLSGTIHRLY